MERPYIVCHILSALDGKIEGAYAGTKADRRRPAGLYVGNTDK